MSATASYLTAPERRDLLMRHLRRNGCSLFSRREAAEAVDSDLYTYLYANDEMAARDLRVLRVQGMVELDGRGRMWKLTEKGRTSR